MNAEDLIGLTYDELRQLTAAAFEANGLEPEGALFRDTVIDVTGAVVDAKQELEHEEWMRRQEHLLLPG